MANVYSDYGFNQDGFDLSKLINYYYNEAFIDDVNYSYEGVTYEDLYEVDWYLGGYYASVFAGSDFSFDGSDVTGTVNAYLELEYVSGAWVPLFGVTGISVSASSLIAAGLTGSTSDDFTILNNALAGGDKFYLSNYADLARGLGGNDSMYGYGGNDILYGGNNNDKLYGGTGNDNLRGDAGNDSLQGDAGKDSLTGGSGADSFIFRAVSESATGGTTADVITDFVRGTDKINLSAIDAFAGTSANDTFIWKGTAGFNSTTKGEVRYEKFNNSGTANDYTMVWIDNDRDAGVEMAIRLTGLHNLTQSDFVM
jgi:Ca2+-binding RTX toxin-like protein